MAKKKRSDKQQKTAPSYTLRTNTPSTKKSFWRQHLPAIIILLLLPFALYYTSIGFDYVLDDKIVIKENTYVHKGFAGIGELFTTDSFQGFFGEQKKILAGGRYRPLSLVTFAIEHQFFGLNKGVGHFNNILLYALNGLLLFRVLLLLMPMLKTNRWFLSLPFVASILFILHPIHVEVTANIKGRDEILALLFSLSALYFSLKYIKSKNILSIVGACVAILLGLLAKENALTWLAVIPLSLYFFTKTSWKNIGIITAALFGTILVYFAIRYNALGYFISSGEESTDIMNNPFYGLDIDKKAATILSTLGMYIKLLIFPHPLTHDYYPYQIPIIGFDNWKAWLSLAFNLGLGIYALLNIKKKSIISFGILYYFITLSIVSNIFVNIGTTMNDRFIYMPSVGFCMIIAYWIARWLPAKLNEKPDEVNIISTGVLVLLVLGYAGKTWTRVPDWKNPLTLNSAAVKYSPNSARANCFMGVALFEDYKVETDPQRRQVLLEEVTYYIDKSLSIYPAYGSALTLHSGILAEHYKRDFDIDKLLAGFTNVLSYRERTTFTDEYIEYLIRQNRNPQKLKQFLYEVGYGINFQRRRSANGAIHYLNYAYQIAPYDPQVIRGLAEAYQKLGNQNKANELLQKLD